MRTGARGTGIPLASSDELHAWLACVWSESVGQGLRMLRDVRRNPTGKTRGVKRQLFLRKRITNSGGAGIGLPVEDVIRFFGFPLL